MNNLLLRASIALVLVTSASIGIQSSGNKNTSISPPILNEVKSAHVELNSLQLDSNNAVITDSASVQTIPNEIKAEKVSSAASIESSASATLTQTPTPTVSPIATQNISTASATVKAAYTTEQKTAKLKAFFAKYNSPLTDYAPVFIQSAEKYNVDWRLVPAITGAESTYGKKIPANSYNAYGWGNGGVKFTSWEQSIDHVTRVISEKYVARGLDTPIKMQRVYAPPSTTWGSKINAIMHMIESTPVQ